MGDMQNSLCEIAWHSPLNAAQNLAEKETDLTLLYSAKKTSYSGDYSYLAWGKIEQQICDIDAICSQSSPLPQWFGYIKYEANHHHLGIADVNDCTEKVKFIKYENILQYNHLENRCFYFGASPKKAETLLQPNKNLADFPRAINIQPNFSKAQYLAKVNEAIEQIYAGNFYQANLTCKYQGELQQAITHKSATAGFCQLCAISPTPYAALIMNDGEFIISASPELFIKIDATQNITTRPIKGTMPSQQNAITLQKSAKNNAENLMIVDLMRNDFSKCAIYATVKVPNFLEIDSFSNLHHLSSTICAKLPPDFSLANVMQTTFPAGSMTGAPKVAAMKWLNSVENLKRNIYSGALGWINGKQCEFSVIIRTLIINGSSFECQFGGGIVSDSIAEDEYEEIMTKAKAIFDLLDVKNVT
jgi:anthranilate/para-aminobenzoate synthase component I